MFPAVSIHRGFVSCVVLLLTAVPAWAGALTGAQIFRASASGSVKTPENLRNVKGVKGPGANAVHAKAGGNAKGQGTTEEPVAGTGRRFDNTNATLIGPAGGQEKAIASGETVLEIARSLNKAYDGIKTANIAFGRDIEYKVVIDNDKVASAINLGVNQPLNNTLSAFAGLASGTFSLGIANQFGTFNNPAVDINLFAEGFVDRSKGKATDAGWAIGIVNDPIEFALEISTEPGALDLAVGSDFELQADGERGFASAIFEIGTRMGDDPLLDTLVFSLFVGIDFFTGSLSDVDIRFLDFDPAAIADPDDFLNSFRSQLAFDASSHLLSVLDPTQDIMLYRVDLPAFSDPITVRYDIVAMAGAAAVPEPSSLVLIGIGAMTLLAGSHCRRVKWAELPHCRIVSFRRFGRDS